MKKTTKKTKRSQSLYPNLIPSLNLKVRQELLDYDYVDKLSPQEKEWLNKFSGEYVGASFGKKDEAGEYPKTNIHKEQEQRKDCYDRNNWRNNDVYSISKSSDMLKDEEKLSTHLECVSGARTASLSRRYNYRIA